MSSVQGPADWNAVERAIAESSYIIELKDNWDDEGATAVAKPAWERATAFLRAIAAASSQRIRVPVLSPADQGSVDLYWPGYTDFLINFPASAEARATFSVGHGQDTVFGTLESSGPKNSLE